MQHSIQQLPRLFSRNFDWTPAENFGKSLVNGEVTHDNAADMTESFNTSLNTDVAQ